jgi:cold shock protein
MLYQPSVEAVDPHVVLGSMEEKGYGSELVAVSILGGFLRNIHRSSPCANSFCSGEEVVKEKGVVKWFNNAKGYGFIQRSTGEDVFVHFSAIDMNGYRSLDNGVEVEFEVKQGPKGLQAENVIRV